MASIYPVSPRDMHRWLNDQLARNIAKSRQPIAPATRSLMKQIAEMRAVAREAQNKYRAFYTAAGGIDVVA